MIGLLKVLSYIRLRRCLWLRALDSKKDHTKTIVRNEMENGSTERNVKLETDLTEPQGKFKNPQGIGKK